MTDKIKEIVLLILKDNGKPLPTLEFNENTKLREELGFDSFNLAELTVHVEEEFGVDIFEDGIINTLGEIYRKLDRNKQLEQ